jgi:hypothetical protein
MVVSTRENSKAMESVCLVAPGSAFVRQALPLVSWGTEAGRIVCAFPEGGVLGFELDGMQALGNWGSGDRRTK